MSFTAQYYDAGLEISEGLTTRNLTRQEQERVTFNLAVAVAAQNIPRRVGAEATGEELAQDKRKAKRVSYALTQCLKAWGGPVRLAGREDEINREAAQLVWDKWWADLQVELNNKMRLIVTWQMKTNGDPVWMRRAVVRLQNEQRWVQYALR